MRIGMPKKGITGHDEWVVTEALATALVARTQPTSNRASDGRHQITGGQFQPGTLNLHLAQAKCRLNPHGDRSVIYREYGFEDREV
jgi:hypothetical protein